MKITILILLLFSFKLFSQENIEMPVFPNCEKSEKPKKCFRNSITMYLVKNTNYSLTDDEITDLNHENIEAAESSKDAKIEIVECHFIINYHGKIKKTKIGGNIKKALRKVFKDNLKRIPVIKPGTLNGEPVNLPFILPVLVVEL